MDIVAIDEFLVSTASVKPEFKLVVSSSICKLSSQIVCKADNSKTQISNNFNRLSVLRWEVALS